MLQALSVVIKVRRWLLQDPGGAVRLLDVAAELPHLRHASVQQLAVCADGAAGPADLRHERLRVRAALGVHARDAEELRPGPHHLVVLDADVAGEGMVVRLLLDVKEGAARPVPGHHMDLREPQALRGRRRRLPLAPLEGGHAVGGQRRLRPGAVHRGGPGPARAAPALRVRAVLRVEGQGPVERGARREGPRAEAQRLLSSWSLLSLTLVVVVVVVVVAVAVAVAVVVVVAAAAVVVVVAAQ